MDWNVKCECKFLIATFILSVCTIMISEIKSKIKEKNCLNKELFGIVVLVWGGFFVNQINHYSIPSCLSKDPTTTSQFSGYEHTSRNPAIVLSQLLWTEECYGNNLAPLWVLLTFCIDYSGSQLGPSSPSIVQAVESKHVQILAKYWSRRPKHREGKLISPFPQPGIIGQRGPGVDCVDSLYCARYRNNLSVKLHKLT